MNEIDPVALEASIRMNAPSFVEDGRRLYIVERDLLIGDDQLLDYCQQFAASSSATVTKVPGLVELTAAAINGKPMRWVAGTTLSWRVHMASFPQAAWASLIRGYTQQAADEWNAVARKHGLPISFEEADSEKSALFAIRYQPFADGTYAVAFFPSQPVEDRKLFVGPLMCNPDAAFDPIGVMRHELGHVLGFRHEHIRPESPDQIEPWVVGKINAKALTTYDRKSVMHYPLSAGHGTNDFTLTRRDKEGFAELYSMSRDDVVECSR